MNELLVILLSGVSAAAVSVAGNIVLNRLSRRDVKKDREQQADCDISRKLDALCKGVMYLELDKIKNLGMRYIDEHEIDYDDRRLLHKMHDNYHNDLGGNGDLDVIMAEVDRLPLKYGEGGSHDNSIC